MESIDTAVARLCNRLMGAEQQALDTLTYSLDELEYIAKENPDREDIRACIEEIKSKIKADEAEHWVIANRWCEHFDGIAPRDEESGEDTENEPEGAEDGEQGKDTDDEE